MRFNQICLDGKNQTKNLLKKVWRKFRVEHWYLSTFCHDNEPLSSILTSPLCTFYIPICSIVHVVRPCILCKTNLVCSQNHVNSSILSCQNDLSSHVVLRGFWRPKKSPKFPSTLTMKKKRKKVNCASTLRPLSICTY